MERLAGAGIVAAAFAVGAGGGGCAFERAVRRRRMSSTTRLEQVQQRGVRRQRGVVVAAPSPNDKIIDFRTISVLDLERVVVETSVETRTISRELERFARSRWVFPRAHSRSCTKSLRLRKRD